ncbi:S49 family peptidase [Kordiimonas lacus]|uniref:Signal peptide peptidase SppA n=1 Tax=Kordiimonas lacus TaxID=637679 RepID=A0A1G7DJ02_9PROT|nr:S49 family peptidase [Kordiimonas lacus]SDE51036.1 signal peptide peptidase SppA [Kordiimonas lacus]
MANRLSKFFYELRRRLFGDPPPVVAVVRLYGVIAPGQRFKQNLNMASLAETLEHAFTIPGLSAVALQINSPGGSPVQSALITKRIRDLAREKDVPVLAFAEDVAASGGYMLALAGDEIYANESSIIGSIGVIASGFGFDKAIEKLGIDRRLYTAGERKAMLDSFSPEKEEDVERLKEIQEEVHEHFKSLVRERRGKRLKGLRGRLFSGDVFTGADAVKMGLVDGLGDAREVLRDRFGKKVRLRLIGERKPRLGSILGLGRGSDTQHTSGIGQIEDMPHGLLAAIEERLFWNRFGL